MGAIPEISTVEAGIRCGTYEGFGDEAVALYARLERGLAVFDEPIDLGDHALDVGGKYGQHYSMIKATGPREVTVIEPDRPNGRRGVDNGFVPERALFAGTIERYVAEGGKQGDSLFLLNMLPRLARNAEFLGALSSSVALGGLLIVSCHEPETDQAFHDSMIANQGLGMRPLRYDSTKAAAAGIQLPDGTRGRNKYLTVWRRE